MFEEAFGRRRPLDAIWTANGRYFDALRPGVEPGGFSSPQEVTALRHSHLSRVRALFTDLDILVFTLGLTETWVSSQDGAAYSIAPGVIAGAYDPNRYHFVNFRYNAIYDDLVEFIKALRGVNAGARLLLTVSPVPLAATATGQHVLSATTYSKSVLRSVAGDVAADLPGVYYFPSYEVITGQPARHIFYNEDLRTIRQPGVDQVMRHFFGEEKVEPPPPAAPPPKPMGNPLAGFEHCEERLLRPGRRMKRLRLFGDLHLNHIWAAWLRMSGRFDALSFGSNSVCVHGANVFEFETTETPRGLRIHSNRVAEALPDHPGYVNSAFQYFVDRPQDVYVFSSPLHSAQIYRHPAWRSFCPWTCAASHPDLQPVSQTVCEAWFDAHLKCRLMLLEAMKRRGFHVAVVEPPKPLARTPAMFALRPDILVAADRLYRDHVMRRLDERDVPVIAAPAHSHADGFTREVYANTTPDDPHHGNLLYGAEMMLRILNFAIDAIGQPSDRAALARFGARAAATLPELFPENDR